MKGDNVLQLLVDVYTLIAKRKNNRTFVWLFNLWSSSLFIIR